MATKETWEKVQKYFPRHSDSDKWGSSSEIADDLLLVLFDLRSYIGVPIYVLGGVGGNHSKNSFHYIQNGACACDIAIPDYPGSPVDLLFDVFRFDFRGVGFYPDWKYKEGVQAKGLHLDRRPLKWDPDFTLNYKESRWLGVKDNGKQIYLPLTYTNLKQRGALEWK